MSIRDVLEEILAAEGLAPLDGDQRLDIVMKRGVRNYDATTAAARTAYLEWARGLLRRRDCFPRQRADASVRLRAVWRLHAEGKSNAQVARRLRTSRGVVEKALRAVVTRAPPPPVANPWRRSGRDKAWVYIEAKRNERRSSMANEEKQKAPAWVRYALIRMRSLETVNVPGVREKGELIDVDGRAHAGGIDVKLEGLGYEIVDKDGKVTMSKRTERVAGTDLVITVPWYKIAQAERVVEGA